MAPRTKPKPAAGLKDRTPVAEWAAAAAGLILTVAVLGVTLWELASDDGRPPALKAQTQVATQLAGGWMVPLSVRNESFATAADVEVEGVQILDGVEESRSATFPYVPAHGLARGGMVFPRDPARYPVTLSVMSYRDP